MLEQVGRYQILEKIGQGGFAVVYRGQDTTLHRQVALKELRPFLLQDESWVRRFQQEAQTVAQLDEPHIIPIYDIYSAKERLFIVMRLVNGPNLETVLSQQPLPWAEAIKTFIPVAEALNYAHRRNILHRDLKPHNILLDPERGPQLSDFGLARLTTEHHLSVSASGSIVGTPNYIAPELWEGRPATRQSDIYALGCILYEMLTGQKLFQGQTPLLVMKAHFEPINLAARWPADAPPGLQSIIATALQENPDRRYSSATKMALELAKAARQSAANNHQKTNELPAPGSRHTESLKTGPLLTTKLYTPPLRANYVRRPRLTRQLSRAVQTGCKLTLISAAAGFGKSSLVNCWLHVQKQDLGDAAPKAAWFSLDEGDNDPVRFLTYLVAGLQTIDPNLGQTLLQVPQLPPPEALATALINNLATVPDKFVLALDDYHLISTPYIHQFIEFIIERQPPQMHLVLITREDPPLPLSRLRARGNAIEIRQDDLRFTAQEAATFLNDTMGLQLSEQDIEKLDSRTEGWIAGLQLAALSLQGRSQVSAADFIESFSGTNRYVIDYLVEEVINQQPQNIRQFLQQTSILKRFCAPLCNAVTDLPGSRLILNYLEQVNLFLIPLDDRRKWYRYHHLFAEFLQTELPPEQQKTLHQRASRWFADNGYLRDAINHALAANDIDGAAELILQTADSTLRKGALVTLASWLNALPDAYIRAHSQLATYRGWSCWIQGEVEAAESYVRSAQASLPADASDESRGKLVALQASLSISRQTTGSELARQAIELLKDADDSFFTGMALLVLGEAQNLRGDTRDCIETLQETVRIGRRHNDHFMIVGALTNLAQQLNWTGRRQEAEILCYQSIEESTDDKGRMRPLMGLSYVTLAEVEFYSGNLEQTHEHLQLGLDMINKFGMAGFAISAKLVLAPLQYALGQPEAAIETTRELMQMVKGGNFDSYVNVTAALEADYKLKAGQLAQVEAWAAGVSLPGNEPMSLIREFELQAYVRYLLATNQPDAARDVLAKIERSAKNGGRTLILMINHLLQARTYALLQQPEQVKSHLQTAITLGEPGEYRQAFVQEGPALIKLLPPVRDLAPQFIDEILALAARRFPSDTPVTAAGTAPPAATALFVDSGGGLVEPLTERELEVLQLIAAGESNKEAAAALVVTVGTVKKHLSNIFGKLGVNSRTQAVAKARELNLLR
ncbi:MAG: hypothetical protein D6768_04950 [Chloroflexi bacterium]|nr:MAG: hypothetical protein D6768_04950 [Chloroflexota bacterium]